jgi:hypothetical protein
VAFISTVLGNGAVRVLDIEPQARDAGLLQEGKSIGQSKSFRLSRQKLSIKPFQKDGAWWWALPTQSASASGKKAKASGAVGEVVGILRGVISGNMIIADQAARSNC